MRSDRIRRQTLLVDLIHGKLHLTVRIDHILFSCRNANRVWLFLNPRTTCCLISIACISLWTDLLLFDSYTISRTASDCPLVLILRATEDTVFIQMTGSIIGFHRWLSLQLKSWVRTIASPRGITNTTFLVTVDPVCHVGFGFAVTVFCEVQSLHWLRTAHLIVLSLLCRANGLWQDAMVCVFVVWWESFLQRRKGIMLHLTYSCSQWASLTAADRVFLLQILVLRTSNVCLWLPKCSLVCTTPLVYDVTASNIPSIYILLSLRPSTKFLLILQLVDCIFLIPESKFARSNSIVHAYRAK